MWHLTDISQKLGVYAAQFTPGSQQSNIGAIILPYIQIF